MFNKKIFLVSMSLLLSLQTSFAKPSNLHLELAAKAEQVLAPKSNALSLAQVKEIVAGDNVDVKLAYENLYQAHKKVSVARATYFPYGLGTVAQFYFFNVLSPILLVELVTSLPSKMFAVSQSKYLRTAQYYNYRSIKENIKKEVASFYFNVLKEEAMLKLVAMELQLMETLLVTVEEKVQLGLAPESDLLTLKVRMLDLRDQYLTFKAYFLEEVAAFNIMIGRTSQEAKNLELQPVSDFLDSHELTMETQAMLDTAVSKSFEIMSANAMVSAAYKGKKSVQWSILSFSGIGFGYGSRVRLESSKIEEAKLRRRLVEETLVNNVYTFETKLRNTVAYLETEVEAYEETRNFMMGQLAQFKAGELELSSLLDIQFVYMKDLREMVAAHYESMEAYENLNRLVLGNIESAQYKDSDIQMNVESDGRATYICLGSTNGAEVKLVNYSFNHNHMHDMTSYNSKGNFRVKLKGYNGLNITGTAKIVLRNGEVIKKQFSIR